MAHQRLVWGSAPLRDSNAEATLAECGVEDGATLHVMACLMGGMPKKGKAKGKAKGAEDGAEISPENQVTGGGGGGVVVVPLLQMLVLVLVVWWWYRCCRCWCWWW